MMTATTALAKGIVRALAFTTLTPQARLAQRDLTDCDGVGICKLISGMPVGVVRTGGTWAAVAAQAEEG